MWLIVEAGIALRKAVRAGREEPAVADDASEISARDDGASP
jgi:hypothetical protein